MVKEVVIHQEKAQDRFNMNSINESIRKRVDKKKKPQTKQRNHQEYCKKFYPTEPYLARF